MSAQHTPGPWSVLRKTANAHLVTRSVRLPNGAMTPEFFRRAGGCTFQRKPSAFRTEEAAQTIASLLNEEARLVDVIERDAHTDNDSTRLAIVRAAIAKATGSAQ